MITVKLQGRLGNQLFQVATAISYALKHGLPYHIPPVTIAPTVWKSYFVKLQNKHYNRKARHVVIKELGHEYNELPPPDPSVVTVLDGYFQSEKYFKDYRDDLLKIFKIPYNPLKTFVSIHVRRGDYVTQFPDKHPAVNYDYIRTCVFDMVEQHYKSFVVCSDDMPWCEQKFQPLKVSGAEFTWSKGHKEIEDLALMSCCEHNIISNSSFSWWAAWLNQNPNKIVYTPSEANWFGSGNAHLSTKDIIPQTWKQIKF